MAGIYEKRLSVRFLKKNMQHSQRNICVPQYFCGIPSLELFLFLCGF